MSLTLPSHSSSAFATELATLDAQQLDAVRTSDHCVVLAGPGSGKTKTMVVKIANLLHGEVKSPQGVACLTYSTETVREIRKRIRNLELMKYHNCFVGTVHGFCLSQILMPYGNVAAGYPLRFTVPTRKAQMQALNLAVKKCQGHTDVDWSTLVPIYRKTFPYRDEAFWTTQPELAQVSATYEEQLHSQGLYDFDDQVLLALRLLEANQYVRDSVAAKFPWLVVDEYQDLGYPLHRIVTCLLDKTGTKLFAVGDPDQSIYSFQGANPDFLNELQQRADVVPIRLENNYRSTEEIVKTSQLVLGNDRGYRAARDAELTGKIYPPICYGKSGFAGQLTCITQKIIPFLRDKRQVQLGDIAILALDKYDAENISEALNTAGIPFVAERDAKYDRTPFIRWVEDLAAWCDHGWTGKGVHLSDINQFWFRLLDDLGEFDAKRSMEHGVELFACIRGLTGGHIRLVDWVDTLSNGLRIQGRLSKWAQNPDEVAAWAAFVAAVHGKLADQTLQDFSGKRSDRVVLTTLHSSKGLEYDAVILPGLEDGRIPRYKSSDRQKEEYRRLFYVAITRAKRFVFLLYSGWYIVRTKQGPYTIRTGPSPYLQPLIPQE